MLAPVLQMRVYMNPNCDQQCYIMYTCGIDSCKSVTRGVYLVPEREIAQDVPLPHDDLGQPL